MYLGFDKLKDKLANQEGVSNPGALAASIGRRKYSKAGMSKKAAAGRKHKAQKKALSDMGDR